MTVLRVVGLILPLALDTFAVAAAVGMTAMSRRRQLRFSLVFAVFEGGTPAVGLLLGGPLGHALGAAADYIAIGILMAFGAYTLLHQDSEEGERAARLAGARGVALLLLGLSVSLDELAIGFTLGLLRVPVVPVLIAIGVQAFLVAQLGFRVGAKLSARFRDSAEQLAGVALIVLGAVLLIERLLH
ncbi:MAG: manganese efflux pump family protein [Frankiaceae bacterium]|jgi:putative Mn2+ efflux pump MntP|nr:manganese efflux pump family protein [Frankiaceae bacterium]